MQKRDQNHHDPLIREQEELLALLLAEEGFALPATQSIVPQRLDQDTGIPLSSAQQRLWFLEQWEPHRSVYTILLAFRLSGPLNAVLLEQSINTVVRRHTVLRTTFHVKNGQPVQVIAPQLTITLASDDLTGQVVMEQEEHVQRLLLQEEQCSFDLLHGPLIRARLLHLQEHEHVLLLVFHHLIFDGLSQDILLHELSHYYNAALNGQRASLAALPLQYADFAIWQHEWLQGTGPEIQLLYWREQLRDAPALLELPTDYPRPAIQSSTGAEHLFALSPALTEQLKSISEREGVTLFITLITAFAVLLARYSGQNDLVIGTPIANRAHSEIEGLIGLFINTLALRINLQGTPDFRTLLARVRNVAHEAYANQDLPFEKLVEEMMPERSLHHDPIFQVMFALNNIFTAELNLAHIAARPLRWSSETAKFDLSLSLTETLHGLQCSIEYRTALFTASTIERIAGHWQTLLESICVSLDRPITELTLLSVTEQHFLQQLSPLQPLDPGDQGIHQVFEVQVTHTPTLIAVTHGDQNITYTELNARANKLARYLQTHGANCEKKIGICMETSIEQIISVLAVLKAGATYVPLNYQLPEERLKSILANADMALVLAQELMRFPSIIQPIICSPHFWKSLEHYSPENLGVTVWPQQLAYVIYTSGSTGNAKGVMVSHQTLVHMARAWEQTYQLRQEPPIHHLQVAHFTFDVFTGDLVRALTTGGQLILCSLETLLDAQQLYTLMEREQIGFIDCVPTILQRLLDYLEQTGLHMPPLNWLVVGAESWSRRDYYRARILSDPQTRVINSYGLTEMTIDSTWFEQREDNDRDSSLPVPIGKPYPGITCYVLDDALQMVPPGVSGELYLGGHTSSRGYLGQPDLTAERFLPDPYSPIDGSRMYKSGDLARLHADGVLSYIGRIDQQIKLRGYRIELNEIELVLQSYPPIEAAAVSVWERLPGEKLLVAYMVPCQDQTIQLDALRPFLQERLPSYMLPARFLLLEQIPLTTSGKLDRNALPSLNTRDIGMPEKSYVPPGTSIEEALCTIWSETLGIERIGIHDNFFALGGHSLLVTRAVALIYNLFQVEIPLRTFFEAPTVAGLAAIMTRSILEEPRMPVIARSLSSMRHSTHLPLSFAQQRLWFLDQWEPASSLYNIPLAWHLTGPLEIQMLERSLNEIIRRHEVLRTTFDERDGQPMQVILPHVRQPLTCADLRHLPVALRLEEAQHLITVEEQRPFNLKHGPLIRIGLLRLSKQEHVLLVTLHHIIFDGWSTENFYRELTKIYNAFVQGWPHTLPELPVQYADFVLWQRNWLQGEVLEEQLAYWKEQLHAAPELIDLSTDYPRPQVQTFNGAELPFEFPRELLLNLQSLARKEGVTLFMVLFTAFVVLLARYSNQDDLVVGTPIANRTRVEIEDLIGFFVNTLALRVDLTGNPTFQQLLKRVHKMTLDAYTYQDLPFEKLVEELVPARTLSHTPLFQVMFMLQNVPRSPLQLANLSFKPMPGKSITTKFDLTLTMVEGEQGLYGLLEYKTDLFVEATMRRLLAHLQRLLQDIVAHPQRPYSELSLLSEEEQHLLLTVWNNIDIAPLPCQSIYALFEQQVTKAPHAIAISYSGKTLTYAELHAQSNKLAYRLYTSERTGQPWIVALLLSTGPLQVSALLAVLQLGGVFVCLDPSHPDIRIRHILAETRPAYLLVESCHADRGQFLLRDLDDVAHTLIILDEPDDAAGLSDSVDIASVLIDTVQETDPVYIAYTSGSTGLPKGIVQSQRSFCQFLTWFAEQFTIEPEQRVAQWAAITFDAAYVEIFATLCYGATLCMLPRETAEDPISTFSWLQQEGVTLFQTVPGFLRYMLQGQKEQSERAISNALSNLKYLLVAGEVLPLGLVRQVLQQIDSQVAFYNLYGPTEAILATYYCVQGLPEQQRPIPVGRAISGRHLLILDRAQQMCPIGVVGEIYIRSPYLTLGYLNQTQEMRQRFLQNPLQHIVPDLVYRTGDLGRWLSDGTIELYGRCDQQIKVHGMRVELEEIEMVLLQHPAIHACAVVAHSDPHAETFFVAYIVSHIPPGKHSEMVDISMSDTVFSQEIRDLLHACLPAYMHPAQFLSLPALPLTTSGKIDRHKLPVPDCNNRASLDRVVLPRTPTEEIIAGIWREVLHLSSVSVNDNFFAVGGHSLLATQVVARIRTSFQREISLRALFEAPTIAGLALLVEQQQSTVQTAALAAPTIQNQRSWTIEPSPSNIDQLSDEQVEAWLGSLLTEQVENE